MIFKRTTTTTTKKKELVLTMTKKCTRNAGSIPGVAQWVKDLALLWMWCRPAAAALIPLLVWELPYAAGAALKRKINKV